MAKGRKTGGRKAKTLDEHLRDGTFRRSDHRHLLEEQGATVESWRAKSSRQGGKLDPADHFSEWTETFVRHTVGRWFGEPFVLEPWQKDLVGELLAVDDKGRRKVRSALIGLPRKNGKSSTLGALGAWAASVEGEQSPDVIFAAGSREQAAVVFDQARAFIESSPILDLWFDAQRFVIKCPDSNGVIRRIAADGRLQHGLNPSFICADELHAFTTPRQEELWAALQTATGAREEPLSVAITTAGYDRQTVLGRLYQQAIELPGLEERNDGSLLVARDDDSGFLFYWYTVPEDADIEDEAAWDRANPASWITPEVLRRQLESPSVSENDFRRLHLNQWTKTRSAWLAPGLWEEMEDPEFRFPPGSPVYLGIDVGLVHDTTAVSIAAPLEGGRVGVKTHVWSAVPDVAAHEYAETGRVDLGEVEEYVRSLAETYDVRELVFDPRFFERSAQTLGREGIPCAPLYQSSAAYADALQEFYIAAQERRIVHDGDQVLADHIEATAAKMSPRGWKVSKMDQSKRIDAAVASVMAHWRAWRSLAETNEEGFVLL
jgi:phage terminase large subunit-like protein